MWGVTFTFLYWQCRLQSKSFIYGIWIIALSFNDLQILLHNPISMNYIGCFAKQHTNHKTTNRKISGEWHITKWGVTFSLFSADFSKVYLHMLFRSLIHEFSNLQILLSIIHALPNIYIKENWLIRLTPDILFLLTNVPTQY